MYEGTKLNLDKTLGIFTHFRSRNTSTAARRRMQRLSICVPPGHHPGMEVLFLSPQGVQMKAVIPAGVQAGQTFHVDVPAPHSPVPVAVPIASPQNALPAGMNAMPQAVGSPVGMPAARSTPPSYNPSDSPPMGLPVEAIVAAQHAECPICFEPLHSAPVGVFVDAGGKRVSMHFFNLNAAQAWLQTGNGLCPVTRKPIRGTLRIPDLRTDPNGWFDAVDLDGDGRLSRREVISALKAQLPIDNAKLDQAAIDPNHWMWQQWDSDGSGHIERRELLHPQGLANYVTNVFGRDAARVGVPSIHSDKEGWFRFWDEDDSGAIFFSFSSCCLCAGFLLFLGGHMIDSTCSDKSDPSVVFLMVLPIRPRSHASPTHSCPFPHCPPLPHFQGRSRRGRLCARSSRRCSSPSSCAWTAAARAR